MLPPPAPMDSTQIFVERMLWHSDPLGYHLTNLLLHIAGTAVMVRLLLDAFGSRKSAKLRYLPARGERPDGHTG